MAKQNARTEQFQLQERGEKDGDDEKGASRSSFLGNFLLKGASSIAGAWARAATTGLGGYHGVEEEDKVRI